MQKTIYYCDHCEKEVNTCTEYPDLTIELNHATIEADLCDECFEKLVVSIKEYCNRGD